MPFLEAGAAGYIPSAATPEQIYSVLAEILAGKLPLAPPIGAALLARLQELLVQHKERASQANLLELSEQSRLTEREQQVLEMLRRRASNQEIAQELMIEVGTVKNHVHSILKKLSVSSREHAAQVIDLQSK
jgi:DNA-binding NarL/FixJ family response regulator